MPGWHWEVLGRYRGQTAGISLKGEKESLGNMIQILENILTALYFEIFKKSLLLLRLKL